MDWDISEQIINWENTQAAIWRGQKQYLRPVKRVDTTDLNSLIGINEQKEALLENTKRFLKGMPANNALLWGARGTGKSSLIKAMLPHFSHQGLRLIEVFKNDLHNMLEIVDSIRDTNSDKESNYKFIIYCDDFSFESNETSYILLKSLLDGSIECPPDNILLYATSNRRHLMPEHRSDSLGTEITEDGAIHYSDEVEEKISLADRFGLWLSFYQTNFAGYLQIVDSYFPNYAGTRDELHKAAKQFAITRASRSGRTALQFYKSFC